MKDLCFGCRSFTEIVYNEEGTDRPFCQECALALPPTSEELAILFLSVTSPFHVGDKVVARQAITTDEFRTEGVGTIDEVDTGFRMGGTPVFPTWHVKIEEPAYDGAPEDGWYTEVCLQKADA